MIIAIRRRAPMVAPFAASFANFPADLVQAVVAKINSTLVAAGTLTWFGSGEDIGASATLPYAVLAEPDEDDEYSSTSGDSIATGHLEIHCYAATKVASKALGVAVAKQLNDAPLVFSNGLLMYLRQSSRTNDIDPDPAPGGGDCWDETRIFMFMVASNLAS